MTYECLYCGKKFETEEEIERHIAENHQDIKLEDADLFTESNRVVLTMRFNNGSSLEIVFKDAEEAKRFFEFLNDAFEFLEVMDDSKCVMSFSGDIWVWRKGKLYKL